MDEVSIVGFDLAKQVFQVHSSAQDGWVLFRQRLEEDTFTWPDIRHGLMSLGHAQFEALFAGLDWRRIRSVEARAPTAIEQVRHDDSVRKFRRWDDP